jgi:hypothetical protein
VAWIFRGNVAGLHQGGGAASARQAAGDEEPEELLQANGGRTRIRTVGAWKCVADRSVRAHRLPVLAAEPKGASAGSSVFPSLLRNTGAVRFKPTNQRS